MTCPPVESPVLDTTAPTFWTGTFPGSVYANSLMRSGVTHGFIAASHSVCGWWLAHAFRNPRHVPVTVVGAGVGFAGSNVDGGLDVVGGVEVVGVVLAW